MLLWIIGATNDDQRKGIADYFTPTVIQMKNSGGSNGVMGGRSMQAEDGNALQAAVTGARPVPAAGGGAPVSSNSITNDKNTDAGKRRAVDERRFRMVEKIIAARLAGDPTLQGLKGQVRLIRNDDGLRIDLIERADFAMFGSGTSVLCAEASALVHSVVKGNRRHTQPADSARPHRFHRLRPRRRQQLEPLQRSRRRDAARAGRCRGDGQPLPPHRRRRGHRPLQHPGPRRPAQPADQHHRAECGGELSDIGKGSNFRLTQIRLHI